MFTGVLSGTLLKEGRNAGEKNALRMLSSFGLPARLINPFLNLFFIRVSSVAKFLVP